jgi:hypothetical protein
VCCDGVSNEMTGCAARRVHSDVRTCRESLVVEGPSFVEGQPWRSETDRIPTACCRLDVQLLDPADLKAVCTLAGGRSRPQHPMPPVRDDVGSFRAAAFSGP